MRKYLVLNTGVVWTENEIRKSFEQFSDEIFDENGDRKFDTFEEYLDYELDLGKRGESGFIEVEDH